ncbi:hypothetical protein KI387_006012, partial [Taxus chinensis]
APPSSDVLDSGGLANGNNVDADAPSANPSLGSPLRCLLPTRSGEGIPSGSVCGSFDVQLS